MFGLTRMFGKKADDRDPAIAFWDWFVKNEKRFKEALTDAQTADKFLDQLIDKMKPFNPWLKALAGPFDKNTYELVITADGDIALFCKVEELVKAAPPIEGWIITAHKPPIGVEMKINMYNYHFDKENMQFYPITDERYPDEVSIVLTHADYREDKDSEFQGGGMIFLENALGEIQTATLVDSYKVGGLPPSDSGIELISLTKLEGYLNWREKEFVEKYVNLERSRPEDAYQVMEATDKEGNPIIATINTGYKGWEYMSAYPWRLQIDIHFKGDSRGLPDRRQMKELDTIENEIIEKLDEDDLVLYVGHDTHNGLRSIYMYTDNYNKVSKLLHDYFDSVNWGYEMTFFIKKDKYWKEMDFFFSAPEHADDDEE
jgi:hypothetical protein